MGIVEATFCTGTRKDGRLGTSEPRRLREREAEHPPLKR